MADANIKYQVDFEANTDGLTRSLSDAVARALGGGAGMKFNTGNANLSAIDAAIIGQGERLGIGSFYENVRQTHLGLDDLALQGLPQGSPVSQFALLAASSRYGYTPSTVQTMIRHAADMEAAQYDSKTDMAYKLDMEAAIGDLRRNQRKDRMAALAETYKSQGEMFAMAAANTTNPAEQRILLSRAASRYGSIASRTLMESGAVDPDTASLALSTSAELSALRSGIKPYNLDNDPEVIRQGITASIKSASQYASLAENAPEGSIKRKTMIALGKESLRGASVHDIAGAGFARDEMTRLAETVVGLNEKFTDLGKIVGGTGGGVGPGVGAAISKIGTTLLGMAGTVMEANTRILEDTKTPYQTKRAQQQSLAQKGGLALAGAGAGIGMAIGGPVGSVIGGAAGLVGGGISYLLGKHYEDERRIGNQYQDRAVDMLTQRNLYGPGVEYNFAEFAEGTGYTSASAILNLNKTADLLPGAMMFGGVSEQQIMALSYMPNYWRGLMEGRSTSELLSDYANDLHALPRSVRQYITSLLPGVDESTRAFVESEGFLSATENANVYRAMDADQYGVATGYDRAKQVIAHRNRVKANENIVKDTATASAPNYYRYTDEYLAAMSETTTNAKAAYNSEVAAAWNETRRMMNLREFESTNSHGKLGDIIIQIDGNTVHQEEYSTDKFLHGQQSYVVGV